MNCTIFPCNTNITPGSHGITSHTGSPLAWPSPFVRHHISHGSPLVRHHLSHGHHLWWPCDGHHDGHVKDGHHLHVKDDGTIIFHMAITSGHVMAIRGLAMWHGHHLLYVIIFRDGHHLSYGHVKDDGHLSHGHHLLRWSMAITSCMASKIFLSQAMMAMWKMMPYRGDGHVKDDAIPLIRPCERSFIRMMAMWKMMPYKRWRPCERWCHTRGMASSFTWPSPLVWPSFTWPSPLVWHHLSHGHHLSMWKMAIKRWWPCERWPSPLVRHHLSHGHHLSYGHARDDAVHLSYGMILRSDGHRMAMWNLLVRHHLVRWPSPLVWPSFTWCHHLLMASSFTWPYMMAIFLMPYSSWWPSFRWCRTRGDGHVKHDAIREVWPCERSPYERWWPSPLHVKDDAIHDGHVRRAVTSRTASSERWPSPLVMAMRSDGTRGHLSHGHHLSYGHVKDDAIPLVMAMFHMAITSRDGHVKDDTITSRWPCFRWPSPLVRHHLSHGHHLLYGIIFHMAITSWWPCERWPYTSWWPSFTWPSPLVWHHVKDDAVSEVAITSRIQDGIIWKMMPYGGDGHVKDDAIQEVMAMWKMGRTRGDGHVKDDATRGMAIWKICCTASSFTWPSPLVWPCERWCHTRVMAFTWPSPLAMWKMAIMMAMWKMMLVHGPSPLMAMWKMAVRGDGHVTWPSEVHVKDDAIPLEVIFHMAITSGHVWPYIWPCDMAITWRPSKDGHHDGHATWPSPLAMWRWCHHDGHVDAIHGHVKDDAIRQRWWPCERWCHMARGDGHVKDDAIQEVMAMWKMMPYERWWPCERWPSARKMAITSCMAMWNWCHTRGPCERWPYLSYGHVKDLPYETWWPCERSPYERSWLMREMMPSPLVWQHLSHGHHLSYGIIFHMAITSCMASSFTWPLPLVQHHLSQMCHTRGDGHVKDDAIPLVWHHLSHDTIQELPCERWCHTRGVWHHLSHGHHLSYGIIFHMAITSCMASSFTWPYKRYGHLDAIWEVMAIFHMAITSCMAMWKIFTEVMAMWKMMPYAHAKDDAIQEVMAMWKMMPYERWWPCERWCHTPLDGHVSDDAVREYGIIFHMAITSRTASSFTWAITSVREVMAIKDDAIWWPSLMPYTGIIWKMIRTEVMAMWRSPYERWWPCERWSIHGHHLWWPCDGHQEVMAMLMHMAITWCIQEVMAIWKMIRTRGDGHAKDDAYKRWWPSPLVWHHLSHGHHLLYGIIFHMAITSCMASSLAWPSLLVRHHLSQGRHVSYGIISRMAITSRMSITSLVRHHLSLGHHCSHNHHFLHVHHLSRTASPLANVGFSFAILSTVTGWAVHQFKNTLDKCRILKKK